MGRPRKPTAQRLAVSRTIRLPAPIMAALDELATSERRTTGAMVTWADVARRVLSRDVEVAAAVRIAEQRKRKAERPDPQLVLPAPTPPMRRARKRD